MHVTVATTRVNLATAVRLMQVGTADLSIGLMRGQLKFLREAGFNVSVVSSPGPRLYAAAEDEGVQAYAVPMVREISAFNDLVSLWRLSCLMWRLQPAITNVGTPKAGLLGGLASFVSRVPCRVYTLRGLRCETATGWKRRCLVLAERIACYCAHRVICVSDSLRQKAVDLRIAHPSKLVVLASGSSNGVDVDRFAPTPERLRQAGILRKQLKIPTDAPVIGFVGRFTLDKGVCELVNAYSRLRQQWPDLHLLMIGDFEEGDPIPGYVRETIQKDPQIVHTGLVQDTAPYYHLMDVFALPTYREGFPNTVLEAQAAGKPVVTTHTTGAVDAVLDGMTGMLVQAGDANSLAFALSSLFQHPDTAHRMGRAGQERVQREFRRDLVWKALEHEFVLLLQQKELPVPQLTDLGTSQSQSLPVDIVL
jgi:glycosyltransferase involved in cell wall biosynthesis